MLALKLIAFVLIISSGVLGRDTQRGNIRHRQAEEEYKYNHPPVPEISEAIPVAIVYEDQGSREDKSIKHEITRGNNVEQVSKETPKSKPTVTKEPSDTEVANDDQNNTKPTTIKQEALKPTTYRPQKEHQIPVAIVYEPETINYEKPSHNNDKVTINSKKIQQLALKEKETPNKDNASSRAQVNGHVGTDSIPSDLNRRRNSARTAPEKQTTVKDNTLPSVQENGYTSSILTTHKPEQLHVRQRSQKSDTKAIAMTVDLHSLPIPTEKQPENLNNSARSLRPAAEQKQTAFTDSNSTRKQISGTPSSVPEPERSQTIKNRESVQQYPKRDNSTRVREVIPIVQSENIVFSNSGNFKYSYEGGDGTKAFEAGELRTFDDETAGEAVSGGFSYTAKDGNEYSLSYTADENGYRPVGAHLPTPPPIPPAIARALAYLATKTTPEPITESIEQ